jgi:hypothetical protein
MVLVLLDIALEIKKASAAAGLFSVEAYHTLSSFLAGFRGMLLT